MRFLTVVAISVVMLLTSCAASVRSQIKQEDKDPSGQYDGEWQANVLKSPGIQYGPGNWQFSCSGKPQQFSFGIQDSQAAVNYQKVSHKAYVNKDGKFRFEIPMNINAEASGHSDSSINRGAMTMIIVGELKSNAGRITYGIEEFGNQGCSAKIKFAKS